MDGKRSAPVSQKGTSSEKKSKGVAAADDLTLAALKDEVVRNLASGKSKGNNDLTLAALKDEVVRNLASGKSKGTNSMAKTSKTESRVDIVSSKEHVETKSSKSESNGESSTSQKNKSGGRIKIVMEEEGLKANPGKKKNEEHMKTPLNRKRGADWDMVLTYLSSPERTSSRLRPRKEVPTFRMVNLDENDNERIVGKRIKVYWSGSRRWFTGCIRGFNDKKRLHGILYEDGDKEELDLKKELFELEIMSTEGFNVRTETYSVKKKLGALDVGEPRADTLKEESDKVGVAEKVMSSSEPTEKKSLKHAGKRGRSKSRGKNTKIKKVEDSNAKMDVDVLPEEVDKVMTDEVCDAEASGEAHPKKEHVEVKKMGSYHSDSEKTVTDDSIELAKLVKRPTSSMKKAMPTAAKVRSSKSRSRKESSQKKKLDADMEVDMPHDEFTMKSVDGNVNIEEAVEGDEVEMQKRMEAIAASEDIMISLSSNLSGIKYNMEDVAANVEVSLDTQIVKEELIGGEINVEVPGDVETVKSYDETVKRNDEAESVSIAEAEGGCEVSVDLQSSILKNPEENPEILHGKLKTENGGSYKIYRRRKWT